jgi:hypothetical protein
MSSKYSPRFHYHDAHGWIVDTIISLNRWELCKAIEFVRKVNIERIKNMTPGPMRDRAVAAIRALSPETVRQNLLTEHPWTQDKFAFKKG